MEGGFKIQDKKPLSEAEMLQHKDFQKVLSGHKAIQSAYHKVWKIWGSVTIGIAAIVGITIFSLPASNTLPEPIALSPSPMPAPPKAPTASLAQIPALPASQSTAEVPEDAVIEPIVEKKEIPTNNEKGAIDIVKNAPKPPVEPVVIEDTVPEIQTFTIKKQPVWDGPMPKIYIAGQEYKGGIYKQDLINNPVMTTYLTRELPISSFELVVNGKVFKSSSGMFSPAMIREIHRAQEGDVLVFQKVKIFMPGTGYKEIPDYELLLTGRH